MQKFNYNILLTFAWLAIIMMPVFVCKKGHGQEWAAPPSVAYYQPMQQKEKKLRIYEIHGSVAVQEGVVAPGGRRSPLSIRAMVGVNLFRLNMPELGGRVLHGPFFTLPFSIEIGYLHDIQQYAPGIGWQFSGRPSKHWKWIFGAQVSFVTPDFNAAGPGVVLGGVYYFLGGFGAFAEMNIDAYFGSKHAFTFGGSLGLLITYEIFKFKKEEEG